MSATRRSRRSRSSSEESFWATSSRSESFRAWRPAAEAASTRSCPAGGSSRLVMPGGPPPLTTSWRTICPPAGPCSGRGGGGWGGGGGEGGGGERRRQMGGGMIAGRVPGAEPVGDLAESHRVVGLEVPGFHPGAVDAGPVGGAEIADVHPGVGDDELGVTAGDGGIVDGDVARHPAADDQSPTRGDLEALVPGGADEPEGGHGGTVGCTRAGGK